MQSIHRPYLAVALAIALFASGLVRANNIQLKFENGLPAITGYSTLEGFRNQIEVGSFQWGVGVGISRASAKATMSAPSVSDIVWTQAFDPSVNALSQALVRGEDNYKSTFSFLRTGDRKQETYLTMTTQQAAISSLSVSSGGGAPSVSASQAFRKYEMEYFIIDPQSGRSTTERAIYDSLTGKTDQADGINPSGAGLLTGSSRGAAGLYLSLGPGLGGESQVNGYKNWIELSSMQMGMGIGLSPIPGKDGFFASRPSISELTVTQSFDRSVISMLGTLTKGEMIPEARLELVQDFANGSVTTMQLKLKDVLISGLSMSSGGDLPQVSESFNFGAYEQTIWNIGADGRRGGGSVFSYDSAKETSSYSTFAALPAGGLGDTGASMGQLPPAGGMASPIPEPHTWALMSGGLLLLGWLGRRRKA